MLRILITGGAGFVGSYLAKRWKDDFPADEVVVLDNLKRRGSELNLAAFKQRGIAFHHGDIRLQADLNSIPGNFDLLLECSAEPSVAAGLNESPEYVLETNLTGTLRCLEFARQRVKTMAFISTSRVYSMSPLKELGLSESPTRFTINPIQKSPGVSAAGISEQFPTGSARSFYGGTKLASEIIIQEYCETYGLNAFINRCSILCGAGQFGKVDQGIFSLWIAHHHFGKPLRYTGFGGKGKQVRDLLHPEDLYLLLKKQVPHAAKIRGEVFNVGGGLNNSLSLCELTEHAKRVTQREVAIGSQSDSLPVDVPLYISDCRKAESQFNWKPTRPVNAIIEDIAGWLKENEDRLRPLFC